MKFLFLEPFYGGSHKDFADGWIQHSRHTIDLHCLPDQFWKWRLRSAALWFAQNVAPRGYDAVITSSMLRVADLKLIWGTQCPPVWLYNHESQLSYPVPPGKNMEYEFVIIDITNGIAANRIVFNSQTHFDNYFREFPNVLQHFPEYAPTGIEQQIRQKSQILHPGCQFAMGEYQVQELQQPPLIIWNHRWEFDKKPGTFFAALKRLVKKNLPFRLALLGETRQEFPKSFLLAQQEYQKQLVQFGYVPSKSEYIHWLRSGAIVVSTAIQENFGISVVEAVRHGCIPILPNRLSYPEILPTQFHELCLYQGYPELVGKLVAWLRNPPKLDIRQDLSNSMERFAWQKVVSQYDDSLQEMVENQ